MKCPICGAAELVHDTRDLSHVYKGETTTIKDVTGDFCPSCGEAILAMPDAERVSLAMRAFNAEVNATLVDPQFILAVRRKLKLGQREASELFGGGINGFSRYETGRARPPLALVQLLRLLDKRPELLEEIRRAS